MATTIKLKSGSGAPLAGDLVAAEPAFDLTNKRLYTENAGGTVIEIGTSPSTIDINAGTIDGTVIGGSSAAAGTFTTFTSTGIDDNATSTAITINSSGNVGIKTAPALGVDFEISNGAQYVGIDVNASYNDIQSYNRKLDINRQGNDIAFDVDTLYVDATNNRVGIGTASPAGNLHINSASDTYFYIGTTNATADARIQFRNSAGTDAGGLWYATNGNSMQFRTNSAERMRIDASGNVGIGTTSPGEKLDVNGTIQVISSGNQGLAAQLYTDSAGNMNLLADHGNNGGGDHIFRNGSAGTELVRILNTGNVGIGTASPVDLIHGHINSAATTGLRLTNSATGSTSSDGFQIYCGSTGQAVLRQRENSEMVFMTNNTERMTINSSGNVGIGTTSPDSILHIRSAVPTLTFDDSNFATRKAKITADDGNLVLESDHLNSANSSVMAFKIDGSERMRIDSAGSVGIGVTPPTQSDTYQHALYGGGSNGFNVTSAEGPIIVSSNVTTNSGLKYIFSGYAAKYYQLDGTHVWQTAPNGTAGNAVSFTERMRIDSSGNLLVGRTSAITGNDHSIEGHGTGNTALAIYQPYTSGYANAVLSNNASYVYFGRGTVGSFTQTGSITNNGTTTAYNTSSDQRLKENIVDAPAGNIDAIRVRSFDWKADGSHQTYGMVAQELVDVAPEAVTQGATDDDMWQVDYSKLVPMMIKEIQDLKAEVAALKGA